MTRRFRCWLRATARPRPVACGRTCGMIVRRVTAHRQRCGSPTRRIAGVSIRENICAAFRESCRPMPTPASIIFMTVARFRKRPAGRMCGASSTSCRWRMLRRWPPKPCSGLASYMPSKERFAVVHPTSGCKYERVALLHCWIPFISGYKPRWRRCRRNRKSRWRSAMRWGAGVPCCVTRKTATSKSTTMPPNGPCEPSLWDGRTIYLRDRTPAANARLQSTA